MFASQSSKNHMRDRKLLQIGLMISLVMHVALFTGYKRFMREAGIAPVKIGDITAIEIPQTVQKKKVIEPAKPFVPIPQTEIDPLEKESVIWNPNLIDLGDPPPPPAPPGGESELFIYYDKKPMPIGGYSAIINNIVYPKMAITIGIEGRTVVQAVIDEHGNVIHTEVIQSVGFESCDQAAAEAIRKTKWTPAMQRDRPVKVKIAIPVDFKIKS